MAQPDYDPGSRYWENMAHVMFGDNDGERLTLDERKAVQGLICGAVALRGEYAQHARTEAFTMAVKYASHLFGSRRERNDRMAKDHNDAIIRHNDHARWRLLYIRSLEPRRNGCHNWPERQTYYQLWPLSESEPAIPRGYIAEPWQSRPELRLTRDLSCDDDHVPFKTRCLHPIPDTMRWSEDGLSLFAGDVRICPVPWLGLSEQEVQRQ